MKLRFGIAFGDLYERAGLLRVDGAFLDFLGEADAALRDRLVSSRTKLPAGKEESDLLVALAPHVEDFLARLFGIEVQAQALAARHHELAPLYSVKRLFVQRRAAKAVKPEAAEALVFLYRNLAALGAKRGPVLFQLPPNLKADVPRLADFLATLPAGHDIAVEFRLPSWFNEPTWEALRAHGAALCIADAEELTAPFEATADFGYLRLRRAEYDDAALAAWAERVRTSRWRDAYVFFKHEDAGKGDGVSPDVPCDARAVRLFYLPDRVHGILELGHDAHGCEKQERDTDKEGKCALAEVRRAFEQAVDRRAASLAEQGCKLLGDCRPYRVVSEEQTGYYRHDQKQRPDRKDRVVSERRALARAAMPEPVGDRSPEDLPDHRKIPRRDARIPFVYAASAS